MGFLIGKSSDTLSEFETTNQRITPSTFRNIERSIDKTLQSFQFKEKLAFEYELQYMTDAYYQDLLALLKNRSSLREGFILMPIPWSADQSKGVLKPVYGSANKIYYSNPGVEPWTISMGTIGKTEFTEVQYGYIATNDTTYFSQAANASSYNGLIFEFDMAAFITAYTSKVMRRFTLGFLGMNSSPVRFFIWSPTQAAWYLIEDLYYYDDTAFDTPGAGAFSLNKQLIAAFQHPWGTTGMYEDFVDSSTKKVFIMACTNTVNQALMIQYARLFVNGYYVAADDPEDIENFSTAFTGAGRTGNIKFQEC